MELLLQDTKKSLIISKKIFKSKFNQNLVHQVITAHASSKRQGTSSQKTRAEVIGSTKKPWKQKGTGRARAGSVKSPIWRSGGVTFASKTKKYKQKINKKMYRNALKSILSKLFFQNRLIFFENFFLENHKTKCLLQKLKDLNLSKDKTLIIVKTHNKNLLLASRNLHKVKVHDLANIDLLNLISFTKVILTVDVIKQFEEIL